MKIIFESECGETTCAVEPGKFCEFIGSKHFGCVPWCTMFNCILNDHTEGAQKGWLVRCPQCLAHTKKKEITCRIPVSLLGKLEHSSSSMCQSLSLLIVLPEVQSIPKLSEAINAILTRAQSLCGSLR